MVMSDLENLKSFSISIEVAPISTMNLLKAHLNTKTKFESLEIKLVANGPNDVLELDETQLSLIS